jgi:type IV pilus assembly protein PilO
MNPMVRQSVFVGLVLAVPVVSYFTVFMPQNERIEEVRADIQEKELMLEKLELVTARASDLAAANREIEGAVNDIESRLPGTREVDVILEQVADLALASRLELEKVKSGAPTPSAKYREQPLEMKVKGTFESFYSFMVELEKLDRLTRLPDMHIKRLDRDEEGALEATFTLSIYFQPSEPATDKEASA